MKSVELLLLALIFTMIHVDSAAAYLDPGTGSILLQGILALIAGAAVTLKLYWTRVKSYFAHGKTGPADQADERD